MTSDEQSRIFSAYEQENPNFVPVSVDQAQSQAAADGYDLNAAMASGSTIPAAYTANYWCERYAGCYFWDSNTKVEFISSEIHYGWYTDMPPPTVFHELGHMFFHTYWWLAGARNHAMYSNSWARFTSNNLSILADSGMENGAAGHPTGSMIAGGTLCQAQRNYTHGWWHYYSDQRGYSVDSAGVSIEGLLRLSNGADGFPCLRGDYSNHDHNMPLTWMWEIQAGNGVREKFACGAVSLVANSTTTGTSSSYWTFRQLSFTNHGLNTNHFECSSYEADGYVSSS